MTHTFANLATLLSNAVAAVFSSPDHIDKIAAKLKCEYPYESVEYVATLLREGQWRA